MILDTNVRLEAVLTTSAASLQPEFHISFIDYNIDGKATPPALSRGASNHITDVVLLAAPTGVTRSREPTYMSFYNKDDAPKTFIVKTDDGTTERIIFKKTIGVGETLQYTKQNGWFREAVV